MYKKRQTFRRSVVRVEGGAEKKKGDKLVAEEPFTVWWFSQDGKSERLASTMRTPGHDLELAAGMLFSENVLTGKADLKTLSFCTGGGVNDLNRVTAELRLPSHVVADRLGHRPSSALPQSACGMCGLDDLSSPSSLVEWASRRYRGTPVAATSELLGEALEKLNSKCPLFSVTGASHAVIVVDGEGEIASLGEDVGRHNACDKAMGRLLLEGAGPFQLPAGAGVLFSSRLSFELAAKAVAAGAGWIAAVGAPTHLAVELAQTVGLPLYGFLSHQRYNRYT